MIGRVVVARVELQENVVVYAAIVAVPVGLRLVFDAAGAGGWENSALKAFLVPLADRFLNTFNNPGVAMAFSALIILSALLFAAWFLLVKLRPINRDLRLLRGELVRVTAPRGSPEAFADVDRLLKDHARFGDDWRAATDRMAGSRLVPGPHVLPANHVLPGRGEDVLRLRALDREGMSFAFFRQLQDVYVGVGLILTFCGLVAGLYFASKGVMSSDLSEAKDGLVKLLNASTFKFMTSIAGVSSSLFLGLVYRAGIDGLKRNLDVTAVALEGVIPAGDVGAGPAVADTGDRVMAETDLDDEENSHGYYMPMADLLTGLIFILIILLTATIVTQRPDYGVQAELMVQKQRIEAQIERYRQFETTYIEPRREARESIAALLDNLRDDVRRAGAEVLIDKDRGMARLRSEVLFQAGRVELTEPGGLVIEAAAASLDRYLPCLLLQAGAPTRPADCGAIVHIPMQRIIVAMHGKAPPDAISGLSGAMPLSGARAGIVYARLLAHRPRLIEQLDSQSRPLIEFRGIGERAPLPSAEGGQERLELIFLPDVPKLAEGAIGLGNPR